MLSGVTNFGLENLKKGILDDQIMDVTEMDIYGEMAKSTNKNCGSCIITQQTKQIQKSNFTYNRQGQTRYVKGWTKMEQIGALKTLFIQMKSYKGLDVLVPLADNGRFYTTGCAKYQYKIGSNCYTKSSDMYNQPQVYSGYGVTAHQVTLAAINKCFRNYFTTASYSFEYSTSTTTLQWKNFGDRTWSKGFSSCF
jgi:hypothetical protein